MYHIRNSILLVTFWAIAHISMSQNLDSLMRPAEVNQLDSLMRAAESSETQFVKATFKGTRVINGHSIEAPNKGVLQVMFSHRFGPLNDPVYTFFGLNQASIRFGFDYGITDRLAVGIGRSSGLGGFTPPPTYDVYAKIKLLRQTYGRRGAPISISLVLASSINTFKQSSASVPNLEFKDRLYYTSQLLIARKFGSRLSLQIMPTVIHRNYTDTPDQKNTLFSLGFAGRLKITRRMAITAEYYASLPNTLGVGYYNPVAIGFEIETGGHVFLIHATNTQGLIEPQFIGQTTNNFLNGATAIRLGFNFSRVFTLIKQPK